MSYMWIHSVDSMSNQTETIKSTLQKKVNKWCAIKDFSKMYIYPELHGFTNVIKILLDKLIRNVWLKIEALKIWVKIEWFFPETNVS